MLELQQGNMLKRIERFASLTVADGTALEQTSTSQDVAEDTSSRIAFEPPSLNLKALFDDSLNEPKPMASKATGKNKHDGRCLSVKVCMDVVRTLGAEQLSAVILLPIK